MNKLINSLISKGYLHSDRIIEAFSRMNRAEFVPKELSADAELDVPVPIGYGQTISQPLTVAFMLELLDPRPGQNILDVGSGSGWTTGLLAYIVGDRGKITAMEIIKELCNFGKENVSKFSFIKNRTIEFHCESAKDGFAENAPYDRILVNAAADEIPAALKNQLKISGKMVIPIANDLWYVERKNKNDFHIKKIPGFVFVPFINK